MTQQELRKHSIRIKQLALTSIFHAQSGHPGGSLSMSDVLAELFFHQMNLDVTQPNQENRDRFVLSKGHGAPAYYAALSMLGYFTQENMKTLRSIQSHLQGHPSMGKTPGVDFSTGSLGQGLSAANGMALAGRYHGLEYDVYCVCGDGELQEGQIWEAAMSAAHFHLRHVILIVDHNRLQIDGEVASVMNVEPIKEKFESFGWRAVELNGHDFTELQQAMKFAHESKNQPTVLIANTIKGEGVSFMEGEAGWHGTAPNEAQYRQAMEELEVLMHECEVY